MKDFKTELNRYLSSLSILMVLILFSCVEDPIGSGEEEKKPTEGTKTYIAVNLDVPAPVDFDIEDGYEPAYTYEDGDIIGNYVDESGVVNGKLLLFALPATDDYQLDTEGEDKAKFIGAGELSNWNVTGTNDNPEIELNAKIIATFENLFINRANTKYYGLILLNYRNNYIFPTEGQTFGEWKLTPYQYMWIYVAPLRYITMTNAPEWKSADAEPLTLVEIDKSKFVEEVTSQTPSVGPFHVQRGLCKVAGLVTVRNGYKWYFVEKEGLDVTKIPDDSEEYDRLGWCTIGIQYYSKYSYPVQVTTGLTENFENIWSVRRFHDVGSSFKRVLWGKCPTYSMDGLNDYSILTQYFSSVNTNTVGYPIFSKDGNLYVNETTFDIDHMKQGQTARYGVRGTYIPAGYDYINVIDYKGESFFKYKDRNENEFRRKEELKTELYGILEELGIQNSVIINLDDLAEKGCYFSISEIPGLDELTLEDQNKIAKKLNFEDRYYQGFASYPNGWCYYSAPIRHFFDDEGEIGDITWHNGDPTYGENNATNNKKYLGRYGIVRNTFYFIRSKFTKIGEPFNPQIDPEDPDDISHNNYMSIDVKVQAWAKHDISVSW